MSQTEFAMLCVVMPSVAQAKYEACAKECSSHTAIAEVLGISRETLFRLLRLGKLRRIRLRDKKEEAQ